ncbi:TIGR02186 family protein [Chelatococcus reniformis]|uniref:Membrane protein n=1 Tax=Chelatococcus reniformis TaxID=1494448 RepID=A0A916XM89_9HYPH|nr:TIGR02186 family protein [Chelatococcus reniformis]GGC83481.1 membrane protein [Chelatococcus reniformis]
MTARASSRGRGAALRCTLPLALTLAAGPARGENLVTSLSTTQIAITSTYSGVDVALFGVIEKDLATPARQAPYDVVVTVRGPRATTLVREKQRLGFVYVNRRQRRFVDLPIYLAVVSTRPVDEIASRQARLAYGLGLEAELTPPGVDAARDAANARFREALRRLNGENGLFVEKSTARFVSPNVFRATFPLPATTPVGRYQVEATVLSGGTFVARSSTRFHVVKTGFEQAVVDLAHNQPLVYGLAAAALSLLFGWTATVVFRRD